MSKIGNLFILGDSYSTFEGYIPADCQSWYYPDDDPKTDVHNVADTWWHQLTKETGANLKCNSSFSGTTICRTGYEGSDTTNICFIGRFKKLLNEGWFEKNQVDTFMIFGGTNDNWANSPLGECIYSDWSEQDLFSVYPALCYLLDRVKTALPKTKVYFILNTELKSEINENFKKICDNSGVDLIELKNISKQNGHPDKEGMAQIKEQVLNYIKA